MHKRSTKAISISAFVMILTLALNACGKATSTPAASDNISNVRVEQADMVKGTLGTEEFLLPNCGGTGELEQSLGTQASVQKSITIGAKARASAGGEVAVPAAAKLKLETEVELSYQQAYAVANSRLDTIKMTAAPGTEVVYVIEWEEQRFASNVWYMLQGDTYQAPYTYTLRVPKLKSSRSGTTCSSSGSVATATSVPPTATPVEMALGPETDLSLHYWTSQGGGSNYLNQSVYHYRAGVSHIEDLPVTGQSISLLTFDISAVRDEQVLNARLDMSAFDVVGDPFDAFGNLVVEEVSYASLGFDVVGSPPRQEIIRLSGPVSDLDVTRAVEDAVQRGNKRFQIRLRFPDVAITDELTQPDDYIEWDSIRLVIKTQ